MLFEEMCANMYDLTTQGDVFLEKLMKECKNNFWVDVFKGWICIIQI